MRLRLGLLSFVLALTGVAQAHNPFSLSGTVTNTTDSNKVISAPMTISFDSEGNCVLRVGPPLYGSGLCTIDAFDNDKKILTIRSSGPSADIACSGTLTDAGFQGSYDVTYPNFPELPQHGNFSLNV